VNRIGRSAAASASCHAAGARNSNPAKRFAGCRSAAPCASAWSPRPRRNRAPQLGTGGYGHAGNIPFPDATFDVVFGNQSFEHWEEPLPDGTPSPTYGECLAEIARVLRPGGTLYLDAPIHLHGHEMFVAGDVPRIVSLFEAELWADVTVERWRYDHAPLPRYPTPAADIGYVQGKITSYDLDWIVDLQTNGTVWLLTVTARKS
jgi:SAM-dependent methyltransferase